VKHFEAGIRREPSADVDVGDQPELVAKLREEIEASGPITFARFMERALYEPDIGYYATSASAPGREGDFLTAPETHPVFGWALARQIDEIWSLLGRPDPFVVREYGAGSGALGLSILDGLRGQSPALADVAIYDPVESEPGRISEVRRRLDAAGHGYAIRDVPPDPITGVVMANELLDALPFHRLVQRGGRLRELLVGVDGDAFVDLEAEPSTPRLDQRLREEGIELAEGQEAEVNLALDDWIAHVAQELGRGILLVIDYGYAATDLYDARRMRGTGLAYLNHRAHDRLLTNVGRQDLTAHVDLTAVDRAAQRNGLVRIGATTQAEFLVGLGLGDILQTIQRDPRTSIEEYLALRSSVMRLLDPAATGKFAVMAFGRHVAADKQLRGLSFHLADTRSKSLLP
jgi:SAM-dependent MidA family methyltransferase